MEGEITEKVCEQALREKLAKLRGGKGGSGGNPSCFMAPGRDLNPRAPYGAQAYIA